MKLSWEDVYDLCSNIATAIPPGAKIYGIPRGGIIPALIIANKVCGRLVDDPSEAYCIIDDIIDSGATRERYQKYRKPFFALCKANGEWVEFPWETKEAPAEENVVRILQSIGEDVKREGLVETPKRYLKFLTEVTTKKEFNFTTFDAEHYDEMIIQTGISFHSLCEHHMAPFFGHGSIAYIPNQKIVGLSKLARTLEYFSKGLQNQERITSQVAEFIMEKLDPKGVAVTLKAQHLCMSMRGVNKPGSTTTTSKMLGVFKTSDAARNEYLRLI